MKINCTKTIGDMKVPANATKAVRGRNFGIYYFANGEWWFTAIHGLAYPCKELINEGENFDETIGDYIGDNEIIEG